MSDVGIETLFITPIRQLKSRGKVRKESLARSHAGFHPVVHCGDANGEMLESTHEFHGRKQQVVDLLRVSSTPVDWQ